MNNRENVVHERRDGTTVTFKNVQDFARLATGRPRLQIGRVLGGPPGWHIQHPDRVQLVRGKSLNLVDPRPKRMLRLRQAFRRPKPNL